MTCHEMDRIIASHSTLSRLAPEAAEHIAECESCQRLAIVFDECRPAPKPSEKRVNRIEAMILQDLAPVQSLAPAPVFFAVLLLVCLTVVAVGSALLGTNGWQALGAVRKIAVLVPLTASAAMLAWSQVRLMTPGSKHAISPARLPIGVLSLLAVVIAFLFPWRLGPAFVQNGIGCMRTGLTCALPAAALFWIFLRRGVALSPGLTGATAGGLAGLVSLAVLQIQCSNLNASHILIWHLGVTSLAMAAGFVIGRLSSLRRNRSTFSAN
jgi:hypothetical protein